MSFFFRLYLSTILSLDGLIQQQQHQQLSIPLHKTTYHQLQPDSVGISQVILKMLISIESVELETQYQRYSNDIHYLKREEKSTQVCIVLCFNFLFSFFFWENAINPFLHFFEKYFVKFRDLLSSAYKGITFLLCEFCFEQDRKQKVC